jgi:regulator of RNase E activity RraA
MHSPNPQIHAAPPVDPAGCFAALGSLPVPILSDNLLRLAGCVGLKPLGAPVRLVGTALTVKTRPGDNLLLYKALMLMQPGHVLVVDGGGDTVNALVGELMLLYALQRGCTGFVIDGAIRDQDAFVSAGFPCHARAVSHRGPYKNGPGHVNVPVSVGGQVVAPGDYVVADGDGIVTFSPDVAGGLIAAAAAGLTREKGIQEEIASGRIEQSWLDKVLAPHGLS